MSSATHEPMKPSRAKRAVGEVAHENPEGPVAPHPWWERSRPAIETVEERPRDGRVSPAGLHLVQVDGGAPRAIVRIE